MRSLLAALLLLVAAPAWAVVSLSFQSGAQTSLSAGADDCASRVTINYQVTPASTQLCSDFQIWATEAGTCADTPGTGDTSIATITQSELLMVPSGSVSVRVSDLPIFGSFACGAAGLEDTARICAAYRYAVVGTFGGSCGDNASTDKASALTISYDSIPPDPPTIVEVTPRDSSLAVRVEANGVISRVQVRLAGSTADFITLADVSGEFGTAEVKNLVNGQLYEVRALAEDAAGNVSAPSEIATGTPVQTVGFFGNYCNSGGDCGEGCGAAAGAPSLLGLLAVFAALRRRKS